MSFHEQGDWVAEQFADLRVLRYRIPGFEALPLKLKRLCYYLYEAALSGRDIIWDQHHAGNLRVRKTLEAVLGGFRGDRESEAFQAFEVYAKRVFFSNGIHHHYSTRKLPAEFDAGALRELLEATPRERLPLAEGEGPADLMAFLEPLLFDPGVDAVRVNQDPEADLVATSANNYYRDLTQAEVEAFYARRADPEDPTPVSHGLNSQLAKVGGEIVERTWKVGGMYGAALERVVGWLRLAAGEAENAAQREALERLVRYYESGELADFDAYNVAWLADTESAVDVINGFIETYGDPLDMRGSFESIVSVRDVEATKRIAAISGAAAWFEAHSPIDEAYKRTEITGVSGKVINVVVGAGDAAPSSPLGINLPNADWIRRDHGSKSVNLGNIVEAYDQADASSGKIEAFMPEEVRARQHTWGTLADMLHTDLHEVIGHGSGRLREGVSPEALKAYGSALEEARADLVGLYYVMDPKLIELGVMPDLEVGRASYDAYVTNALLAQLARIEPGATIEQAHMRNRATVARWALDKGGPEVIERIRRDGRTYFLIRDYDRLRDLWGQLLREVQRIKSEGDFEAGKALIEAYGVQVEPGLHAEVRERWAALGIAPYSGFLQPRLVAERDAAGEIVDVRVEYPDDFVAQMLEYGERYAFLPWDDPSS